MPTIQVSLEEMTKQRHFTGEIRKWNEAYTAKTGRKRTACVRTFGCQMNEHDSEKLSGMLKQMGFSLVPEYSVSEEAQIADLILFNTCCVRENAEEKVYGHLGALKGAKRIKPSMITGVCGCMTEQPHAVDEIRRVYKNVDLVFGTRAAHQLPEYLHRVIFDNKRVLEVSKTEGEVAENVPVERVDDLKAWVTIMYGCNNFCSYCIVPYVRGRERSRKAADILAEVRSLVENGIQEITLLGQNVNSYGKDLKYNDGIQDFADLLDLLCRETEIPRIRFMTSHPKDLSDRLIDAIARNKSVCNQLHLPVQSGSTRVLKEMNRKYTREDYLALVERIRKAVPEITLSTDIIVGFPGETEEDFEQTLSLVEQVRYDSAYTFIYSKRVGTPAATREDQVPEEVVKDRFDRLLALQNSIGREINDGLIGQTVEVLCEGPSRTNENRLTGRTEGNKIVNFIGGDESGRGKMVRVHIDHAQTWSLEGTVEL